MLLLELFWLPSCQGVHREECRRRLVVQKLGTTRKSCGDLRPTSANVEVKSDKTVPRAECEDMTTQSGSSAAAPSTSAAPPQEAMSCLLQKNWKASVDASV
eukprot:3772583-Amphidinium_carterae.1